MNIIELALLAYLGLFLILAKDFQQQAATSTQLDAASVNSCGKAVPTISTVWIVFGVLYFLPVTVLLILVGRWLLCSRGFQILRYVCIIIGGMQTFIYIIHILLYICLILYKIVYYIILYIPILYSVLSTCEVFRFFHSTPMCKHLQLLHILSYYMFLMLHQSGIGCVQGEVVWKDCNSLAHLARVTPPQPGGM